eukprot:gene5693-6277_t
MACITIFSATRFSWALVHLLVLCHINILCAYSRGSSLLHHARRAKLLRQPLLCSMSISDYDQEMQFAKSNFNLQELFWVTPESLSMEVLISTAERETDAKRRSSWLNWTAIANRFLDLLGYKRNIPTKTSVRVLKPPLLFVHGSYHSAWCFAENFMPYFTAIGHDCYAVSLRGTASTGLPPDDQQREKVTVAQHVSDLSFILDTIISKYQEEGLDVPLPVIVSHSVGGLYAQKLLENRILRNKISGLALLCSVPPSGNQAMVKRLLVKDFWKSLRITYAFVFKGVCANEALCRETFFDATVPLHDLRLYMKRFAADSHIGLDVIDANRHLPSLTSMVTETGKASWLPDADQPLPLSAPSPLQDTKNVPRKRKEAYNLGYLPIVEEASNFWAHLFQPKALPLLPGGRFERDVTIKVKRDFESAVSDGDGELSIADSKPNSSVETRRKPLYGETQLVTDDGVVPARLVVGAENDVIVDLEGLQETARYFGVEKGPVVLPGLYHDVMLGPKWGAAARVIKQWIDEAVINHRV